MSHPYVPLGTPVTITVDGFWDGDHNGNQPVIVVPDGQGKNKKYHVPHGALVQTKPEEVEAVEFTVDKTPKPQPTYPDFSEPKLRTATDEHGCILYELGPDRWIKAASEAEARTYVKMPFYGVPLSALGVDVADTGEPLDYHEQAMNATNSRTRKPEPGDRVRVSYEAEYVQHSDFTGAHQVSTEIQKFWWTPKNAEFTVIEPARPAVPEDPKDSVEEVTKDGDAYSWEIDGDFYDDGETRLRWPDLWTQATGRGSKLYPIVVRYELGPVIGG